VRPGATAEYEAEAGGFLGEVAGDLTFSIGSQQESATLRFEELRTGGVRYETAAHAPPKHASGFQLTVEVHAHEPALDCRLAPSAPVAVPGFTPTRNGFPFRNSWPRGTTARTIDLGVKTLPIGDAKNGLCGGMSFAAVDYFLAHQTIPHGLPKPMHEGEPLFDFFVDRLVDSFDLPHLPLTLMTLMDPAYPDAESKVLEELDLGHGRAYTMCRQAWPAIRHRIDTGLPAPICIVKVKSRHVADLGENHQIVVWKYQLRGTQLTLWVYDPNNPGTDACTLVLDVGRTDTTVTVHATQPAGGSPLEPIFCFLPTAYHQAVPPPLPTLVPIHP
jgi:hypothetical protein